SVPLVPYPPLFRALHEVHQGGVERLALVLGIVRGEQRVVRCAQLDGTQGVALGLHPGEDLPGQAAADPVRLDQDQGAFALFAHPPSVLGRASRSARSRSIFRPSHTPRAQMTVKTPPTTNIIGTSRPPRSSSSCTAEPIAIPARLRCSRAATAQETMPTAARMLSVAGSATRRP